MVISEIIGGLGNQMFQYAAGWSYARSREMDFKLDVSGYSKYTLHQGYELDRVFDLHSVLATDEDLKQTLGWQRSPLVRRILKRPYLKSLRKTSLLIESEFTYSDLRPSISEFAYLSGYWQSEKHFLNYIEDIRGIFQFSPALGHENLNWVDIISMKNSVSIHVRRGDFVSANNINFHGVCSAEYFTSAARYIFDRNPDAEFFIFSDDVTWARENIILSQPCHFVSNNFGPESFNDMRLMSLCKHNIIANSSFSWWGAWLNSNTSKIVIAPARWFAADIDTRDLVPSSWVTLS